MGGGLGGGGCQTGGGGGGGGGGEVRVSPAVGATCDIISPPSSVKVCSALHLSPSALASSSDGKLEFVSWLKGFLVSRVGLDV